MANDISRICQIQCFDEISEPLGRFEIFWQLRNRLRRIIKRRIRYLLNRLDKTTGEKNTASIVIDNTLDEPLQAGDFVRIRSKEEIQATLDHWNRSNGCDIMEEMWVYCNTMQKVYKRVERFLDERDYRVKRCNGIVLLERIVCQGTIDYGPCDRSCFFFWREEWLEKVN